MNLKNKRGFSLAEVLMSITIIGVISILSINAVRSINNDYRKMYFVAYNTLLQATGNTFLAWSPNCSCSDTTMAQQNIRPCWDKTCWDMYRKYEYGTEAFSTTGVNRKYPSYLLGSETHGYFNGYQTDEFFCRKLTSRLNTINKTTECRSFINSYATKDKANNKLDYTKGINFFDAFCHSAVLNSTDYNNEVARAMNQDSKGNIGNIRNGVCDGTLNASFITANGQRFYISKILTTNNTNPTFNIRERDAYRLVAVDLNGEKGPNTQLRRGGNARNINSGLLPDIVLFALKADGTVVPLGRPEFNQNYLNAIINYPEYLNRADATGRLIKNQKKNSEATNLFQAKIYAWGPQIGGSEKADIANLVYGQAFNEAEPFSYSTLLYNIASNYPSGVKNGDDYTSDLLSKLVNQFTFDQKGLSRKVIPTNITGNADTEHGCTYRESKCSIEVMRQ